jgi:hypothetical protein
VYHEAIEFDLLERQIDLLDFWTGRMSARRLSVLLRGLPVDSAYRAAVRDDMTPEQRAEVVSTTDSSRHGRWSLEAMLAARNGDLLSLLLWQNGGGKGPQPEPFSRPGVAPQRAPFTEAALTYLLKTREMRGAHPDG